MTMMTVKCAFVDDKCYCGVCAWRLGATPSHYSLPAGRRCAGCDRVVTQASSVSFGVRTTYMSWAVPTPVDELSDSVAGGRK